MSKYYSGKRSRNLFDPADPTPFRLSRTRLDLFLSCPRCFYLDRRLGVDRPPGFPFSLNSAVDALLKKEFDVYRKAATPHPLMKTHGIDAVPFSHPQLEKWRDALRGGIAYLHEPTKLMITGGIDDLWVNPAGELIVADYKATAKESEVTLDADWQDGYKRQVEIYQWLFRQNGFKVSSTAYFVYCNGRADRKALDGKLEFDIKIIPYEGDDSWVEPTIFAAHKCLTTDVIPASQAGCDYCTYVAAIQGSVIESGKRT